MSYERRFLCEIVLLGLHDLPYKSLGAVSRELKVSPRTIENALDSVIRKTFRQLQREAMLLKVRHLLERQPTASIKELSFAVGYKSPRSFARAIRRVTGFAPNELRSRIVDQILMGKSAAGSVDLPRRTIQRPD